MASAHGKETEITVDGTDISLYTKTSTYEDDAKTVDRTGYKPTQDRVKKGPGLIEGKFTAGGWYDDTVSTGTAFLEAKINQACAVIYKMKGTGTGKPQRAFSGILKKYTQTSPHDDIVTWAAEWEIDGAVTATTQA